MNRHARCPVTGREATFYCEKQGIAYYREARSGIIFEAEPPDPQTMVAYADAEYHQGLYADYVKAGDLKLATFERRLESIKGYARGTRLLDVGCSCGFFLEAAAKQGFDVTGVEFSQVAVSLAAPAVRERIICGDLASIRTRGDASYDVVSAFDVIEHTRDPVQFLRELWQALSPGGLLVLTTPDTGHWLRRVMGKHWPMLQPLQHTVLFSRSALHNLLEAMGFHDIVVGDARKVLTADYLFGQIRNHRLIWALYSGLCWMVPERFRRMPLSVNIGEFIVYARKPVGTGSESK